MRKAHRQLWLCIILYVHRSWLTQLCLYLSGQANLNITATTGQAILQLWSSRPNKYVSQGIEKGFIALLLFVGFSEWSVVTMDIFLGPHQRYNNAVLTTNKQTNKKKTKKHQQDANTLLLLLCVNRPRNNWDFITFKVIACRTARCANKLHE